MSQVPSQMGIVHVVNTLQQLVAMLAERTRYVPDQPFEGIVAQGWIGDQPVPRPPWGPFKNANDAIDYVNAKRRKQRGRRELDPNADSFYFCNENFRMEFITQREFLGRIAAQIATLSSSIVVAATATPVPPPTAELEPFSNIVVLSSINMEKLSHEPPAS